jgi:hypothetical protein
LVPRRRHVKPSYESARGSLADGMARRRERPTMQGARLIVLCINWSAFLVWWLAILRDRPFFERETCPMCGGTGLTPWTVQ